MPWRDGVHPMCRSRPTPRFAGAKGGVLLTNVTQVRTVRLKPKSSFTQTIVSFLDKDANSPYTASLHRFTEAAICETMVRYMFLNTHDVFNTLFR
jgi:hypothetical protein